MNDDELMVVVEGEVEVEVKMEMEKDWMCWKGVPSWMGIWDGIG